MVPKTRLEYFKKKLVQQLDTLNENSFRSRSEPRVANDDYNDFLDRASFETDSTYAFRIRERNGRLVGKLKRALKKIEKGTYGICEECKKEISEERLEARLVAELCIKCKKREEADGKIRGL